MKMEGKGLKNPFGTVVLTVLILSLVIAHTQVEAWTCCKEASGSVCYVACKRIPFSLFNCDYHCGCKNSDGFNCPSGYDYPTVPFLTTIKNSAGDTINEYCKLGCASSVCNATSTLKISDPGEEVVNEAVEQCINACSAFCTKDSTSAVDETA